MFESSCASETTRHLLKQENVGNSRFDKDDPKKRFRCYTLTLHLFVRTTRCVEMCLTLLALLEDLSRCELMLKSSSFAVRLNACWLVLIVGAIFAGCNEKPQVSNENQQPNTESQAPSVANGKPELPKNASVSEGAPPATETPMQIEAKTVAALQEISSLAEQRKFDEALIKAQNLMIQAPDDPRVLFMTARLSAEKGELEAAIAIVDSIKADAPEIQVARLGQTSEWLIAQGRLSEAELRLLELMKLIPANPMASQMLYRIYHAKGQRFNAYPHIVNYVKSGSFQLSDLAMLGNIENTFLDEQFHELLKKSKDEQEHVFVYEGRRYLILHDFANARDTFKKALAINPKNLEAWVWLGWTQVSLEAWPEVTKWFELRPDGFESHPQFWVNLGVWYEQLKNPQQSIQAYKRALELNPRSPIANNRIGNVLDEIEQSELAAKFRERAYLITTSNSLVRDAMANLNVEICEELASDYQKLGDDFLYESWEKTANFFRNQQATQGASKQPTQAEGNRKDPSQALRLPQLLQQIDQLQLAAINYEAIGEVVTVPPQGKDLQVTRIEYVEVENEVGLASAEYDWGKLASETGTFLYRSLGGGIAVLDYELDGYPDLYFSRAGAKPSQAELNKPKQFFRNLSGQFVELTHTQTSLLDIGYGQGFGCGDINQDGFLDLAVVNIGSFHVYQNNGDGTFSLMYSHTLDKGNRWVSACAIADINRDALPDLTVATYLGDSDHETRTCTRLGTNVAGCPPQEFPGCKDLFLLSLPEGGFREVANTNISGEVDLGRSLGVVVGDFDQRLGNEIYVSNDETANHFFFTNVDQDGEFRLTQSAGAAGVAVNANGRPQGSMGISVADIDRNGLDDIFVTNFITEYNTLYLQRRNGIFSDQTRAWNLYESSLPMVGFGCMFIDPDLDGWKDLFVVNGNIEDLTAVGEDFKMLPQFYYNDSTRMQPLAADTIGPYFNKPTLARGLATVDFDIDHRVDVVVTYCDQNASLLQNRTQHDNHFLEFELVGTKSDRDAIGSRIVVKQGNETFTASLYSGESYYSSCERVLQIGLGKVQKVDSVKVQWPDGSEQELGSLGIDQRYLVVQNLGAFER